MIEINLPSPKYEFKQLQIIKILPRYSQILKFPPSPPLYINALRSSYQCLYNTSTCYFEDHPSKLSFFILPIVDIFAVVKSTLLKINPDKQKRLINIGIYV